MSRCRGRSTPQRVSLRLQLHQCLLDAAQLLQVDRRDIARQPLQDVAHALAHRQQLCIQPTCRNAAVQASGSSVHRRPRYRSGSADVTRQPLRDTAHALADRRQPHAALPGSSRASCRRTARCCACRARDQMHVKRQPTRAPSSHLAPDRPAGVEQRRRSDSDLESHGSSAPSLSCADGAAPCLQSKACCADAKPGSVGHAPVATTRAASIISSSKGGASGSSSSACGPNASSLPRNSRMSLAPCAVPAHK